MDNLSLFVEALQDLMNEKNIKPVNLHNDTKINLTVIYDWLKKAATPNMKNLIILSTYFECSIEYLTGRTDNRNFAVSRNPETFPLRLRSLLKRSKISIRKISTETGISKSAISYFLNGSVEPLLDNIIKLANYFGCSIDYLVGLES